MSCDLCYTSPKGQAVEYEKIKSEAKKYAVENNKPMAIYKEGESYLYCEATTAFANHYPVREVVSKYN